MGMVRFIPVSQITDPLTVAIGLSGGSGTGKTFSALRIARGLAEAKTGRKGAPIGFIDTENRRALHYKQAFAEMVHFDMRAVDDDGQMVGFGPERWIAVIDAAEAAKLPVLVIDSFSHAWEGVGGVLDLHAQVLDKLTGGDESKRDQRSQLAWAQVKPRYRRLIDRIVRANCDMVICTRAKPVMQSGFGDRAKNARKTKTRREDIPWDPASDGDLMFELTAMMILDPSAPGCPVYQVKCADQFKPLFDPRQPMDEAIGYRMGEWAKGAGDAAKAKEAMDAARVIADRGTAAFTAWWKDATKAERDMVRSIMDDLKARCADADARAARNDDEPFGADPADADAADAAPQDEAPSGPSQDTLRRILDGATDAMLSGKPVDDVLAQPAVARALLAARQAWPDMVAAFEADWTLMKGGA